MKKQQKSPAYWMITYWIAIIVTILGMIGIILIIESHNETLMGSNIVQILEQPDSVTIRDKNQNIVIIQTCYFLDKKSSELVPISFEKEEGINYRLFKDMMRDRDTFLISNGLVVEVPLFEKSLEAFFDGEGGVFLRPK